MFTLILITLAVITIVYSRSKLKLRRQNKTKTLRYHLIKYSLEFLIPFLIIGVIYSLIPVVLFITKENGSLQFFIDFEERLSEVKNSFSLFRLSPLSIFFIYLALFLIGLLRILDKQQRKAIQLVKSYHKYVSRIYVIIVILCSLTLFGSQPGDPSGTLKARIKTIREGYAELQIEVREVINQEIALALYDSVESKITETSDDALDLPQQIDLEIASLRDYYDKIEKTNTNYNYVESILSSHEQKSKKLSEIGTHIVFPKGEKKHYQPQGPPNNKEISIKKIKAASKELSNYKNNLQSKKITLLKISGGKELTCQIPKILTGEIKSLFQPWIDEYPILEPIIDIYKNTFNSSIEDKINANFENLTGSIVRDPKAVKGIIQSEASVVLRDEEITIPNSAKQSILKETRNLNGELQSVKNAKNKLFKSNTPGISGTSINSNLSVDISWNRVPEAESYRIYWYYSGGSISRQNSELITQSYYEHWPDRFPVNYRVAAVKGDIQSNMSGNTPVKLLSSQGGTRCEICGNKSVGYCHNRDIYVCSSHNTYTSKSGTRWRCP